jgi:hypothetical protein
MWGNWWNKNWEGKSKYLEAVHLNATLFSTSLIGPDLGIKPAPFRVLLEKLIPAQLLKKFPAFYGS